MKTSLLAGAVVGALVTVTVYEGSARVSSPEADAVDVLPGTPQTFGSAASTTKAPRVAGTPSALENRMAALKEEMEAVKSELQRERFAGALVRGQLSAERGEPVDWTDRVAPESFRPEQFEAALEKQLSELPDFEIGEIRCEEYPCVAAVRYTGDRETEQWQEPLGERIEDWTDAVFGGKRSMSMNTSRFQNDDRDERYVIFGAFEGDGDLAVKERTDWRIDELVDEIGEAVAERAQP